jgi:DNA repair protein RadC
MALEVIDVRLLDHLIIAGTDIVSFAESGLL